MANDFTRLGFLASGTDVSPIIPALEAIWQNSVGKGLSDFNFRSVTGFYSTVVFIYSEHAFVLCEFKVYELNSSLLQILVVVYSTVMLWKCCAGLLVVSVAALVYGGTCHIYEDRAIGQKKESKISHLTSIIILSFLFAIIIICIVLPIIFYLFL